LIEPFTRLDAVAAPLDMENLDTGQIFPSRFLRKPRSSGYRHFLFRDLRYDREGNERPEFILNQPAYRSARILVAAANFGCGSSRESAVLALADAGFRCVIAPSFGDIFLTSCPRNGLLPATLAASDVDYIREYLQREPGAALTVDLDLMRVETPDGRQFTFDLSEARKQRLKRGMDDCALAMEKLGQIERFERDYAKATPWLK